MTGDPLAPIAALPGVAEAAQSARDALGEAHRHRTNRRDWPRTATEAAMRGSRSSSVLAGGTLELAADGDIADPVLAGAVRVGQSLDGDALNRSVSVFTRAPLQAFAKLHVLAASDAVSAEALGRPRPEPDVAARLDLLGQLITGGTTVAAPVLAAIVHGELLTLKPFGFADGVIARAASRLVCVATGLDPHNLGVPEVAWMRRASEYVSAAEGFAAGSSDGIREWVLLCCAGLEAGAREALSIAEAAAP